MPLILTLTFKKTLGQLQNVLSNNKTAHKKPEPV